MSSAAAAAAASVSSSLHDKPIFPHVTGERVDGKNLHQAPRAADIPRGNLGQARSASHQPGGLDQEPAGFSAASFIYGSPTVALLPDPKGKGRNGVLHEWNLGEMVNVLY